MAPLASEHICCNSHIHPEPSETQVDNGEGAMDSSMEFDSAGSLPGRRENNIITKCPVQFISVKTDI